MQLSTQLATFSHLPTVLLRMVRLRESRISAASRISLHLARVCLKLPNELGSIDDRIDESVFA
jgi:hypothetical protein